MPAPSRTPSDQELSQAITAIRVAWLRCKFISDRLKWAAMEPVLDVDAQHMAMVDDLVNRDGK